MDVSQCRQNKNGCLTSKIDDFLEWAIQNVSGHPNLPSEIQIGGQIWMSDIFKFGCQSAELFYDVSIFAEQVLNSIFDIVLTQ